VWIAQLFILGLVVGYMRDQIKTMRMESEELEVHLSRQIADIKDINESNARLKGVMEQQLIDQKDSIGKIYTITHTLDQYMPDEVMFYAVEMLMKLMRTRDVALYNVVNQDYARIFSASSAKARSLGNSIRYREMTEVYEELTEEKVYINKNMDPRYPLMARAIYENGDIKMIIMLWGLSWEKMTLGQANFLTVVSYLIQNAVLRAQRYMQALEENRYSEEGSRILREDAFKPLVKAYMDAEAKDLAECVFLKIDADPEQYRQIDQLMAKKLRDSDYLGILPDGKLYALLANTTKENAGIFSQSQGWIILAEALRGHGERAFTYFMENAPAAQNDKAEIRRLEPYCYGQFTEGKDSPNFGRSHVHWLTGTASTVMVGCVEGILGMRPDLYGLRIAPSIPKEWELFEIDKDFRGCHLHITVKNPGHAESGCKKLFVNGQEMKDNYIPQTVLTDETDIELIMS